VENDCSHYTMSDLCLHLRSFDGCMYASHHLAVETFPPLRRVWKGKSQSRRSKGGRCNLVDGLPNTLDGGNVSKNSAISTSQCCTLEYRLERVIPGASCSFCRLVSYGESWIGFKCQHISSTSAKIATYKLTLYIHYRFVALLSHTLVD
jgi:hypothetical protein